jgi:putative ABC transport system substrate-binding protein
MSFREADVILIGLIAALALGSFGLPVSFAAQTPPKIPRVGYVGATTSIEGQHHFEVLRQGLRELGYVEGQTIALEPRWAEGRTERLPDLVAELVRLKVDVMVVATTPAALAAKNATQTIPIVMVAVGDPVGSGLVASLARRVRT